MIHNAIYDILSADGTIIAGVSSYNSDPAIFTSYKIPSDVTSPFITITTASSGTNDLCDPRCYGGWTEDVAIRIYQNKIYSIKDINDLNYRVFDLLNRTAVSTTDAKGFLICRGGVPFTDEQGFPGIVSIVTAYLWRT